MILPFLVGVAVALTHDLPAGSAPEPVALLHFPDRFHAYVWRNWTVVPVERIAKAAGVSIQEVLQTGRAMGLPDPPRLSADFQRRSALTVIRRNWHLLPYDQLLKLLGWTPEQLAYALREDDFLYIKLGSHKPRCEPLRYRPPNEATRRRQREIAQILRREFPDGIPAPSDPPFSFVRRLSKPATVKRRPDTSGLFSPRYCYSYFALYGDPLLEPQADPYPDGYLQQLAAAGVNGVWLQAVLYKLAPFPWNPALSDRWEERLANLRRLTQRAQRHGIRIYLYLNEPRAMPLAFYTTHPALKGVTEGDYAALCSSHPEVQKYLADAVATICRAVPDLGGFFTITASENLTNCWSHGQGNQCERCRLLGMATVIAQVNYAIRQGIRQAGSRAQLIVWDWGWPDDATEAILRRLPDDVALQSVSEWSLPIQRGGVPAVIGEYALSAIGPGPRARKNWELARKRGMKVLAKIQAANSWELSAVPYIPALENVAQHIANLRAENVDGLMLGWTLGGYPSPNLEVVAVMGRDRRITPEEAMLEVATRRFGKEYATTVVQAWKEFSAAFREFPFHISTVYHAPLQFGPANLLWEKPTGYRATMVGFCYDDLDTWRGPYPTEVFIQQLLQVADGFDRAVATLRHALQSQSTTSKAHQRALQEEIRVGEAAAIHFRSTAMQARFVQLRQQLQTATSADDRRTIISALRHVLDTEIALARRLLQLQAADSRIGFEASNQYYYLGVDLMEKILNACDLRDRWLPAQSGSASR
ncbi:MAG: hypothetical protein RMJ43_12145 [Chloroherpetonaceae bacterium]|nr:hypothetical protein [Chthonomonadaceae bacterium]MDW8208578.1 hypothetical protein [Chloroherpetonaceae bacterium]